MSAQRRLPTGIDSLSALKLDGEMALVGSESMQAQMYPVTAPHHSLPDGVQFQQIGQAYDLPYTPIEFATSSVDSAANWDDWNAFVSDVAAAEQQDFVGQAQGQGQSPLEQGYGGFMFGSMPGMGMGMGMGQEQMGGLGRGGFGGWVFDGRTYE